MDFYTSPPGLAHKTSYSVSLSVSVSPFHWMIADKEEAFDCPVQYDSGHITTTQTENMSIIARRSVEPMLSEVWPK